MATVPSFDSFAAAEVLTAAKLNKNVRDAGNFFRSPPLAVITSGTATTLTTGVEKKVTFDTSRRDSDGMVDLTNNQLVVKTAGVYLVSASLRIASNSSGYRRMGLYLSGTGLAMSSSPAQSGTDTWLSVTGMFACVVGTTIDVRAIQTSGVDLDVSTTSFTPNLSALWVSA